MAALSKKQIKLLLMALDSSVSDGEALNALRLLRKDLSETKSDKFEFVAQLQKFMLLEPTKGMTITRPDYGMCIIPFGHNKGEYFMDVSPSELRNIKRWCQRNAPEKFEYLIHDIDMFLED